MGRGPLDTIPQHQLVAELRRAIDVARNVSESSITYERAVAKIYHLCDENPKATLRAHVLHNLGCTRRRWLRQLSAKVIVSNTSFGFHLDLMGECQERDRLADVMSTEPVT